MIEQKDRSVSVIKDADGNNIVMINDICFKGKRNVNWDGIVMILLLHCRYTMRLEVYRDIMYFMPRFLFDMQMTEKCTFMM